MKPFAADQVRFFISIAVFALLGVVFVVVWPWIAPMPWVAVATQSSFGILALLIAVMLVAQAVIAALCSIVGAPVNYFRWSRVNEQESHWLASLIGVISMLTCFYFGYEYLYPATVSALSPVVEPRLGTKLTDAFIVGAFVIAAVIPAAEIMLVLKHLFRRTSKPDNDPILPP